MTNGERGAMDTARVSENRTAVDWRWRRLDWERFVLWIVLGIGSVAMIGPFYWMFISSFKSQREGTAIPPTWWPQEFTLKNWQDIGNLTTGSMLVFFRNSVFVVIVITLLTLFTSSIAGYVFAKFEFRFKNVIFWLVISMLVVPFSVTLIPLFNMVAGAVIFRERMNRIGVAAIACAAVGVALQALALGHFPVISLVLAITFAAYGVVRKRVNVDAQAGLLIECLILGIPGAMFIVWLQMQGVGHLTSGAWSVPMMIGSGVVTVAPLALFSWAARRMPLSTMGFLQFIGPTLGFAIGLFQGEAFTPLRAASFAFIWGAAVIFAYGAWRAGRRAAVVA